MGVKSSVRTSTIQPAAPKLSKVNFNILNLKNIKKFWFPSYFLESSLYFWAKFSNMPPSFHSVTLAMPQYVLHWWFAVGSMSCNIQRMSSMMELKIRSDQGGLSDNNCHIRTDTCRLSDNHCHITIWTDLGGLSANHCHISIQTDLGGLSSNKLRSGRIVLHSLSQ